MKPSFLFFLAFVLAIGVLAYTSFVPADSPESRLVLAGPGTARIQLGESLRNILFFAAIGIALVVAALAFWKPRIAAIFWAADLILVTIRALLPSFPIQQFPFASVVFWVALFIQGSLCYCTFRALVNRHNATVQAA